MNWRVRQYPPETAGALALELGYPDKMGRFLAARGFRDASEARSFLDMSLRDLPGPETMPGMPEAVALLLEARQKGATVAVSGDYDADGLTATALLKRVLEPLGLRIITRIPNRLVEGYGLSPNAVRELHGLGATYLVTVDSGVSDVEAVLLAAQLGMKVVVTDHHQLPPELPEAAAIVNPHLGGGWESAPLAGVGVAFMLAWALRNACLKADGRRDESGGSLVGQLALVALGTVADLAPLRGPNRTLVHHGLNFLMACDWPGVAAMRRSLKLDAQSKISARDVGFKLAPRLNAAGRLGSAQPALDVLTTKSPAEAERLVRELEALNRRRYETQSRLVDEALDLLEMECPSDYCAVVLAQEGWPRGLLGLVASKVAEKTGRPTVIFSIQDDLCVGSGRTAGTFDLFEALSEVRHLCLSMGGHSQAAGLRVDLGDLELFKEAFEEAAGRQSWRLGEDDLMIDLVATLPDLGVLAAKLALFEPYGQGHPVPVVAMKNLKVLNATSGRGGRVELRLSDGLNRLNVSGFNLSSRLDEIGETMDVVVSFEPENNSYGTVWRLVDFREPKRPE
ncbi:MAG: single-stranded-DNA-specific exonuclease RecJ [Deltaproteobacteria bacterium]|nr:single-stranded-DNA-specific exonuclease RecJ [Deltaproteobacteria bacterium]